MIRLKADVRSTRSLSDAAPEPVFAVAGSGANAKLKLVALPPPLLHGPPAHPHGLGEVAHVNNGLIG